MTKISVKILKIVIGKQSFITTLKMSQDLETKIMKHNIEYLYTCVSQYM